MKHDIKTLENKSAGTFELNPAIFSAPLRMDIVHRMVRWQMAKARSGNHQTKEIWAVRGTTKKPFRQKGTGNARQGSLRSPHMRGGAVVFGPHKRDHGFSLPKKVRKLAMRIILSSKVSSGAFVVVDELKLKDQKSKGLQKLIQNNGWTAPLFVGGTEVDQNFCKASRNIPHVNVLPQQGINVLSVLKCKTLVMTKDAIHHLEARLG